MTVDRFAHYDGAYVLNALDDQDRAEFEAHLVTCDECRARVAEVGPTAARLAGLSPADVEGEAASAGPIPDTLLPGLFRRAERERARRRLVSGSIAAVAAACLITLVAIVWPASPSSTPPRGQALTAVRPSPVTATAALVSKRWGTEIDVSCRYSEAVGGGIPYELRVVDTAGQSHSAGSWTLAPGPAITFKGGTDVPRAQIARVLITSSNGTPILQLTL
ncbi:MAG TPA: zf-HC2 domain-containing protein [Jatrophihabitans sp.]|jgi:predicted anti-sigma-YlaC factor YlaD|nr:zf-HC2 domain-containing protein [Jatrophihabitans sp.]